MERARHSNNPGGSDLCTYVDGEKRIQSNWVIYLAFLAFPNCYMTYVVGERARHYLV